MAVHAVDLVWTSFDSRKNVVSVL